MTDLPPLPAPAPPPLPAGRATAREDYAALLQQVHDSWRELADANARREQAVDAVWLTVVERLGEVTTRLRASADPDGLLPLLDRLWAENDLTLTTATGRRIDEVSPEEFEVLATVPAESPADAGRVAETPRPAVRRGGRLLRPGRVIVLTGGSGPT